MPTRQSKKESLLNTCIPVLVLAFFLCSLRGMADESLEKQFLNPPDSAKSHTWWHWMNGNVSKEGITADLEAMKRVGIGGFQAFHVTDDVPAGPVGYLSPQWRELMKHAISEADRLGLEVSLHNCAGWSSSGGPWITPEYSKQRIIWSELRVTGPRELDTKLAQPKAIRDFYRDILVLAFPTPESERDGKQGFRIEDWRAKAGFVRNDHIRPDTRMVATGDRIPKNSIVNLSAKVDADGQLKWKVPEGSWTILRFGHTTTGVPNRYAPREGMGLESDKLSIAASELHWKNSMQKVIDDVGPLAGQVFNNILIDSYEVGQQNWTKGLEKEFEERLGYDLFGFFPALTGRVVETLDISERLLWDFRRLIADLMSENYFGHFAEMCHRNGMTLSIEPFGKTGNFDSFDIAGRADIPMGEWWVREGRWHLASSKMAASAAHTHGKRLIGAEAFTAGGAESAFVNHPYNLKTQGDYFFCQGVNRFIFHTFAHQPWPDVKPGMTMGPHGFQNNRNNTWYEPGRSWMQYLARCQYLLQEGTFQADLCYYPGEDAPQMFANRWEMAPVPPYGYDYDTLSTETLMKLTVKDGRIILPDLMEYRLLVLPDKPMRPEIIQKIHDLVQAGAHVVGPKPTRSPSLQNYPKCDQQIQKLADQVWGPCDGRDITEHQFGKGKVYWTDKLEPVLASMDILPDVEVRTVQPTAKTLYPGIGYEWIHRKIEQVDMYFVSNQQEKPQLIEVVFRISGKTPHLWNPYTGTMEQAPKYYLTQDGRTAVRLYLDHAGSVFVIFAEPKRGPMIVDLLHDGKSSFENLGQAKALTIHRAVYGVLDGTKNRQVDVTAQLRQQNVNSPMHIRASNDLAGDPARGQVKQLRVHYSLNGRQFTKTVMEKETLTLLPETQPEEVAGPGADLAVSGDTSILTAWKAGTYELLYADGKRSTVSVSDVPESIDLTTDWTLDFPAGWGAPPRLALDSLISWTEHTHPDVQHFSGTAVYKKKFDVPNDRLGKDTAARLDLGDVQVMAEVIVNGKNLGIFWKPPFTIDVSGLLNSKDNQLEVRVTNLWVNRLIGDAQYPDTCTRSSKKVRITERRNAGLQEIPDWLLEGKPRPATQRKTFVAWEHYEPNSPLVDSGLIGPVKLVFGLRQPVTAPGPLGPQGAVEPD